MAPPLSRLTHRVGGWISRRLRGDRDGGFILLESLIAIAVITIVMAAVTTEFVSNVASTSRLRAQQGAIQIADSSVEQIRALHASDLVTGRDASDVAAQYTAAPPAAKAWLYTLADQAVDPKAAPGAGAAAAVPTSATQQKPGSVAYTVNDYLQNCAIATGGTTGCVAGSAIGTTSAISYLQAVVAVTWSSTNCGLGGCAYVTATVVSAAADPTFRINSAPYAAPQIIAPGTQTNAVNDQVSLQLQTQTGTGVPTFTWAVTGGSLPSGLSLSSSGIISGTVSGAAGSYSATVQVTDQFGRTDTQTIAWTVESALAITAVNDEVSITGSSVSLQLSASGGGGSGYTFADPNNTLPPGLTISAAGKVTGTVTPPAPHVYTVNLVATDAQTCNNCANASTARTASVTFRWSVSYPPLAISSPGPQRTTVAQTRTIQMSASGGDSSYTWSAAGLPANVTINATSGTITGTPTTTGSYSVTVTASDSSAGVNPSSTTFTWTVYAAPALTNPGSQQNSVGATVSVGTTPSCPNTPCTYTLANGPTNLTVDSNGVVSGTIGGAAASYPNVQVTVTDNGGATATTTFAWTVRAAPTIGALSTRKVTIGTADGVGVTYTCPLASCTVALSGSVPGIGLTTSATSTTDNSTATSLTVSGNGTLYLRGSVQSSAVGGAATSATYMPAISITSPDGVRAAPAAPTWTAYVQPTVAAVAARRVSETAVDSYPVTYTCPNATCTLTLSGSVPGLGLRSTASVSGDNSAATTLAVTSGSGTAYVTGTVQNSAVTGTDTSHAYTPSLTISDGNAYTSAPTTATWTAYVAPTLTAPAAQTHDVGAIIGSLSLAPSCPDGPCTYTWTLPKGLSVTSGGAVTGTIASDATTGAASAQVTATDADGATATASFTWTVYAQPSTTGLTTRTVTVGASYSTPITYSCPRVTCTITLSGSVPGIGLSATANGSAATSLPVTGTSGTAYVTGTVGSSAVPMGSTSNGYTLGLAITDGGSITTSTSATWTAYPAPTIGAPSTRSVSIGANDNVGLAYTCPTGTCTITLSGSVPGIGLGSTGMQSGDRSTSTSLSVTAASGTVYLSGTVQGSAVPSGSSKTWTPAVTITDGGSYTSPAGSATWTAYPAPNYTALSTHTATVGTVDSVQITYNCPTRACTFTLATAYPGVGLSTSANQSGNNSAATTATVTQASGNLYITGTVQASAVTGGAGSTAYATSLTVTDGGSWTSTSTATWTALALPTVAGLTTHSVSEGELDSVPVTYTCPTTACTLTLSGTVPGDGLSTTAGRSGNNATTTLSVTAASGTVYVTGTIQTNAVTGTATSQAYTPTISISDVNGNSTSTSAHWTAYPAPTVTVSHSAITTAVTAVPSELLAYTCPQGSCTIYLGGSVVPGLGLSTTPDSNANNSGTGLTVTTTSGTVWITGQVQSSATGALLTSSTSYATGLAIVDGNGGTGSATQTWTARYAPAVSWPGDVTVARNGTVAQAHTVTCPAGIVTCTIAVSGLPSGIGISSSPQTTAQSATSTTVFGGLGGNHYLTGRVSTSATPGTYNVQLAISATIGGTLYIVSSYGTWTVT